MFSYLFLDPQIDPPGPDVDDEEDEDDEELLEAGDEEHGKGDDDGDAPMEGTEAAGDRCGSDGTVGWGWVGGGLGSGGTSYNGGIENGTLMGRTYPLSKFFKKYNLGYNDNRISDPTSHFNGMLFEWNKCCDLAQWCHADGDVGWGLETNTNMTALEKRT